MTLRISAFASTLTAQEKSGYINMLNIWLESYGAFSTDISFFRMLNGEGARIVNRVEAGITCNVGDSHDLAKAPPRRVATTLQEREVTGSNGFAATRCSSIATA